MNWCRPIGLAVMVLAAWTAPGQEPVRDLRSRHYEITTDMNEEEARRLGSHMDEMFDEYASRFEAFGVRNSKRIRLHLYETNLAYLEFLASHGINGINTAGVFFVDGGEAFLASFAEAQHGRYMIETLQHEGFHQFAFLRIGTNLPVWANEGLAEYFGDAIVVKGRLKLGLAPLGRLEAIRQAIELDRAFSMREMLEMSSEAWLARVQLGDERAHLMYAQAWSMAHFMIHASDGKYARMFIRYVELLTQGYDQERAFSNAFGTDDVASFDRAWRTYVTALEPDELSTAGERLSFLGAGLLFLADEDMSVRTIEGLKQELRKREFEDVRYEHGIERVLTADDDRLFTPPEPKRKRGEGPTIVLEPSSDPDLPPEIRILGLRAVARLRWTFDESGEPRGEIVFE